MQQLLTAWAWLLLLTMQGSRATILSKSTIEKCDRTTSKDMKCFQKIVVQLAVAAGKDSEEDEISATIDTVSNGSFTRSLQDPQIIKLSKSSVGYAYPLEYLQNFNRQPYEEYRRVDKCKAEDCWDANLPEAKKKIYWGVCCLCGGNSHHRGVDAKCGAAKHDIAHLSRKGTRHCLKWHPQWFPTFIIGLATMEFNIYIDISVGYGNSVTRLNLNPNNLMDVNDDKTVIAKLEGDLVSYKMPPSFPSVFLSHPPNPNGINASEWLIIDRHKYSESGAVCDLIGTSYEAFTLVNLPCTRQFGYCLAYQLEDYIREEVTRKARGLQPYLSIARYGAVRSSINAKNIEILLIPINQTQNSIVVLELSADNLEFIVSRSPGKIISVKSSKFEALSHDGYSEITVVNTGELVAAFTLGVDCPAGIQASPAVTMSLRPNEPKTLHFELNAESFNSQTFNCSVRLRDSEGEVADALEAFVSVTATQFTNVTKLQSEGAFLKLDRLHNGGGFLGVLGNALGGVFGFTKTIASNFSGAFARLGIGLIKSIFGPNVGALVEGFFQAASALMDWILGGFGIGNIFGTGQCNCASEYDVLCILANFCFAKIIGLLGFLLVLVAVALSCVLLYRMGVLGPVGTCLGHSLLLPMSMCKSEDDEDGESDKEQDMPTSSNMKEPHIVSVQSQNVVPWTSMPPQAPYQYGYG